MTYPQINSEIANASSGEAVHFAEGTYEFPISPVGANIQVTSGARLVADGAVTLRGVDPTVGVIVILNSINSGISGFVVENAKKGIIVSANFDTGSPVYITNNTIQNVETGMSWDNKDVVDNSRPSIIVDSNYIRAVHLGNLFDKDTGDGIVNDTKAWAQVSNNTFEQITGVVYEPPVYYVQTGTAASTPVALGRNAFDGNININMAGVTMPPDAYSGVGGPLTGATTAGAGTDIPDANGEHHIAIDPDSSYPFTNYVANVWQGNNVGNDVVYSDTTSAKISWSNRLLLGSPHWADGRCKNPDGSERHYCGAFAPMGDWNADGKLNDYDQSILESKKTGEGNCSTDAQARSTFDFDNDCDIDNYDHVAFLDNGFVGIPQIPAVSTWGLVVLALGSLIAGTVVLKRRGVSEP